MNRRLLLFFLDWQSWTIALIFASLLRYEFDVSRIAEMNLLILLISVGFFQVFLGLVFGLYRGRNLVGSFEEVFLVVVTATLSCTLLVIEILAWGVPRKVALSVPVIALPIGLLTMLGFRYIYRLRRRSQRQSFTGKRTLLIGANFETEAFLRSIRLEKNPKINPVAILENSEHKHRLKIAGVPVVGRISDALSVVEIHSIELILIVDTKVSNSDIGKLNRVCAELKIPIHIVPRASEAGISKRNELATRELDASDLLGRRELDLDYQALEDTFRDKSILITGAGGSIGSELCRQIHQLNPRNLIMLDRDESALHALQLSISGNGLLTDPNIVLADIRDKDRLENIFSIHRPEIVFHAAALKHLTLLEAAPAEAWKTNVVGTQNLLDAAENSGVDIFVNISTDKAADPISVLGFTKQITEKLTSSYNREESGKFVSVRFGNVLGSRGSMLETFSRQISMGGPIMVTHPDVTRYFMTIPEASQLVLQAAVIGEKGEALVLDMGEPVKILDVAKFLISRSGKEIKIEFSGLRPGEKLNESLAGIMETKATKSHKLISHVAIDPLRSLDEAKKIFENRSDSK